MYLAFYDISTTMEKCLTGQSSIPLKRSTPENLHTHFSVFPNAIILYCNLFDISQILQNAAFCDQNSRGVEVPTP